MEKKRQPWTEEARKRHREGVRKYQAGQRVIRLIDCIAKGIGEDRMLELLDKIKREPDHKWKILLAVIRLGELGSDDANKRLYGVLRAAVG